MMMKKKKKAEDLNSAEDVGDISIKLNGLNVYIANIDYENDTFQIMNYLEAISMHLTR